MDSSENTKQSKPIPTRIVGIDFGLARMGLAISDERKIIASPLITIKNEKKSEQTADLVLNFLSEHQSKFHYSLEEIVVGLPLMMSGKVGFLADEVKYFVEFLKRKISIPIILWDERLTTVQAERSMREGSLTRKRRAQSVDVIAAVLILQSYLDRKKIQ